MRLTHRLVSSFVVLGLVLGAMPALAAGPAKGVVNINKADAAQLALLPRVGPSVAQRIVEFRKENGPFKAPEDLMLVRGIGEKTYQLIKPHVTVSGETTLTEKVRVTKAPSGGSR